jgi:hypothetical protein
MLGDHPAAWLTASPSAKIADIKNASIEEQASDATVAAELFDALAALDPAAALEAQEDLDDRIQYVLRNADGEWVSFLAPSRFAPNGVTTELWSKVLAKATIEPFEKKAK